MFDFAKEIKKQEKAAEKYKDLPLKEFIRRSLIECGENVDRMNNVYIDEFVQLPDVWGCFKRGDEFVTYCTNERNQVFYETYDAAADFFVVFVMNSLYPHKYGETSAKTNNIRETETSEKKSSDVSLNEKYVTEAPSFEKDSHNDPGKEREHKKRLREGLLKVKKILFSTAPAKQEYRSYADSIQLAEGLLKISNVPAKQEYRSYADSIQLAEETLKIKILNIQENENADYYEKRFTLNSTIQIESFTEILKLYENKQTKMSVCHCDGYNDNDKPKHFTFYEIEKLRELEEISNPYISFTAEFCNRQTDEYAFSIVSNVNSNLLTYVANKRKLNDHQKSGYIKH